MSEMNPEKPTRLTCVCPDDARVIDALLEHGPVRLAGGLGDRGDRVVRGDGKESTDASGAGLANHASHANQTDHANHAAQDGELDELRELGELDGEQVCELDAARTQCVRACIQLLDHDAVEGPAPTLVAATMARLEQLRQREQFAEQVNALAGDGEVLVGRALNWRQITAIAAMVMIAVSVMWPVLTRARVDAQRMASANNLAMAGHGFGLYAADHNDVMPKRDVAPGADWWRIGTQPNQTGQVRSNSAHLFVLIRQKYVDPVALSCPSNPDANRGLDVDGCDWPDPQSVSFSYQNQFGPMTLRLSRQPQLAVLANRNPMFQIRVMSPDAGPAGTTDQTKPGVRMALSASSSSQPRFIFQRNLKPVTGSLAYQGRGQNVLLADGQVMWTKEPILPNGDNIWLARGIDDYAGNEVPQQPDDAFLVP